MIRPDALIAKFQYAIDNHFGYIYGETHTMWTEEKQKQYEKDYADDPDRANSCKYGSQWIGHWVTDCSGLFSWAFSQLGRKIYHGSNTIYNKYCTSRGTLKNGLTSGSKPLLPGTAVFTGTVDKKPHIGLYVGSGWVIEAAGAKQGVIRSKVTNKKWTFWGELKGVDYDGGDPVPEDRPTLRKGDQGQYVTLLQTMLIDRGYSCGSWGADGDFGSATLQAVKAFQRDNGLDADGIVGAKTWAALDQNHAPAPTYTVTISGLTKDQVMELLKQYPTANVTEEV